MDTGKLLLIGGIGVGGYFAYQWYYGSGGQADQALCSASGVPAAQLQVAAAEIIAMAAKQGITPAAYLAQLAAIPASTSGYTAQQMACLRVALAQYPTAAAAAAGTVATTAATGTVATTTATGTVASTTVPANQSTVLPPVSPNPAASSATLDGMYTQLKNNVASDSFFTGSGDSRTSSVDHWNVYLQRLVGTQIPGGMFSSVAGDDPNNLTAAQYWAVMAPWVASTIGLSGLGNYGGLGAVVRRYKR